MDAFPGDPRLKRTDRLPDDDSVGAGERTVALSNAKPSCSYLIPNRLVMYSAVGAQWSQMEGHLKMHADVNMGMEEPRIPLPNRKILPGKHLP